MIRKMFMAMMLLAGCDDVAVRDCALTLTCPSDLVPPKLRVSPALGLGFECVMLGCDESRSVIVTNQGGGILEISGVELTEGSSKDFSLTSAMGKKGERPVQLRANESLEVLLRYRPSDGMSDDGSLRIHWKAASGDLSVAQLQTKEVPLRSRINGARTARALSSSLNFGFTKVSQTSMRRLAIENTSSGNAVVSLEATQDEAAASVFSVVLPGPIHLNPGQKFEVPIAFSPRSKGVFEESIRLKVLGEEPSEISVLCMGTSIESAQPSYPGLERSSIEFGRVKTNQTATKVFSIKNEGGQSLELGAEIHDSSSKYFRLLEPEAAKSFVIQPMETKALTILATSNASGLHRGALLLYGLPGYPDGAPLYLAADVFETNLELSEVSLHFESLAAGWASPKKHVALRNSGDQTITIQDIILEEGSSSQIRLLDLPPLPMKLAPEEGPLSFSVQMLGHQLGTASGRVLIKTDEVGEQVLSIEVSGSVKSCNERCKAPHATSECIVGSCEVRECEAGWHDADRSFNNGCECREDLFGRDIGDSCSAGLSLGWIGDNCSYYPHSVKQKGTLHNKQDVDLYFISAEDAGSLFCDIFGDSYRMTATLLSAPPGLVVCINNQAQGAGCGGFRQVYDERLCGNTKFVQDGGYAGNNSSDATVWVMWHPDAKPMCAEYEIEFSARY